MLKKVSMPGKQLFINLNPPTDIIIGIYLLTQLKIARNEISISFLKESNGILQFCHALLQRLNPLLAFFLFHI